MASPIMKKPGKQMTKPTKAPFPLKGKGVPATPAGKGMPAFKKGGKVGC